jgi:Phosphotransferase enzyme family
MQKLRALVLEPNVTMRRHYNRFPELFRAEEIGYECEPEFADTADDAIGKISDPNLLPWHVFICDLSLGSRGVPTGQSVVRVIKERFPEIFCILTSNIRYPAANIVDQVPHLDMYINKGSFNPGSPQWKSYILEFARKFRVDVSSQLPIDEMHDLIRSSKWLKEMKEYSSFGEKRELTKQHLDAMLRQVLFRGHGIDPLLTVGNMTLRATNGGRSESLVLKANIRTDQGASMMPTILKMSGRESARRERDNYEQYVKWHLSHQYRVDSLGYGETKDWGLFAYSFAFGDEVEPKAITNYIEDCEFTKLQGMIPRIFSLDGRKWYSPNVLKSEVDLETYYSRRLFPRNDSTDRSAVVFDNILTDVFAGKSDFSATRTVIDDQEYPGRSLITAMAPRDYLSCICHGDLNSNNILVAAGAHSEEQLVFIDFQDTGRGHVFHDFISFEAGIRLRYGASNLDSSNHIYVPGSKARTQSGLTTLEYIAWEKRLAELPPGENLTDGPDIFVLMSEVRRWAQQNFPTEDWRTYLYGVAIYNFRLLRISDETLSEGSKARCLAAVLTSIKHLETYSP